ncbi:histone-like nucleoid-structuring protein Lsr2 [Streptomyces sp. NPDC087219]|uniref:Lsr2 family DNA-binding protein n=1 Tax=Streptomyces sp. NPDC087219 TaxID=3365770 RepID=UPI00382D4D0A
MLRPARCPGAAGSRCTGPVTAPSTRSSVSTSTVRAWAGANGYDLPGRGRVPFAVFEAWRAATHSD